jgi:dethiobiotin synthetase
MEKFKKYFVTAIGTDIGKTLVSSILVNALKADYWKPIQCGNLDYTDSDFIRKHTNSWVHPEKYCFKMPASPHIASTEENENIELKKILIPSIKNHLIIEGAGGMMVPLNEKNDLVIDIAKKNNLPLIIVSSFYLGSINHTLLTLEYAKQNKLKVAMLIFSGEIVPSSLEAIKNFFPDLKIGFVPKIENLSKEKLIIASEEFKKDYLYELVG